MRGKNTAGIPGEFGIDFGTFGQSLLSHVLV
jgi:hypothetical protein